jgi:16S rRNA (guanine527-N7)-methyltransferase
MTVERLQALLAPYLNTPLAADQYEMLLAYLDLLLKWNAKTNLTAIRDPEQIVQRHFGESLALAESVTRGYMAHEIAASRWQWEAMTSIGKVADLGSGAGFPGLPFAIYARYVPTTLIESQNKKATFLKEVTRSLNLANVHVENRRGEDLPEKFDVVMMRAVEQFERALRTAANLVVPRGRLALLISEDQIAAGKKSLRNFDAHWGSIERGFEGSSNVIQLAYL